MQEFYQWLIFESFIILLCVVLYLFAAGIIKTQRTERESFQEWRKTTGGVVRFMCILVIIVSISIIIYKYAQVTATLQEPPSLNTD